MHPLLKLVKFDNVDISFYKYNIFGVLRKDVNHYHELKKKMEEEALSESETIPSYGG